MPNLDESTLRVSPVSLAESGFLGSRVIDVADFAQFFNYY